LLDLKFVQQVYPEWNAALQISRLEIPLRNWTEERWRFERATIGDQEIPMGVIRNLGRQRRT
jgi:hypothetical protein